MKTTWPVFAAVQGSPAIEVLQEVNTNSLLDTTHGEIHNTRLFSSLLLSYCYRENFDEALYHKNVEFIQRLCDTVNPEHTVYALEPLQWMLPWNPQQYLQFLRDVNRKGFGVHMDIFNFVRDPYTYTHQEQLMEEAFSLLGSSITSSHLKDITMHVGTTVMIQETPIGTGEGKLECYLHHLSKLSADAPVLIEHLDTFGII